jgi:hypothetical protein
VPDAAAARRPPHPAPAASAAQGPCTEPRPWGWNVVNNAKWQSWRQLGDMPAAEAMRLFVRTLEEEAPGWWTLEVAAGWAVRGDGGAAGAEADAAAPTASAAADSPSAAPPAPLTAALPPAPAPAPANGQRSVKGQRSVAEVVVEGSWVSPFIASEARPPPRYEHAAALAGPRLFVVGGAAGGRYLSDAWALDLESLSWACVARGGRGGGLPPVAGAAAVAWGGGVLLLGGHFRAGEPGATAPGGGMPVRRLDPATGAWALLEPRGEAPAPRGGHTATLVGSRVYVFGGEDARRRPLAELWVLDLAAMEWARPAAAGAPPPPRAAHAAAAHRGRYVVVVGGGSTATCTADVRVLDTQAMAWSAPACEGGPPPPRAGHGAAALGATLYVVGGGDNAAGRPDMWALDLAGLEGGGALRWSLVGHTPPDSAVAAEGLSLVPVPMAGCIAAFGGYTGRFHNAVHVYRPEGYQVVVRPPAKAAAGAAAPRGSGEAAGGAEATAAATGQGDAARARGEAAAREAVSQEVSLMRRQLATAAAAAAEAERALGEAREALAAEHARAVQLEVEAAAARRRADDAEGELARRSRVDAAEAARRGGGLWNYITGGDAATALPKE